MVFRYEKEYEELPKKYFNDVMLFMICFMLLTSPLIIMEPSRAKRIIILYLMLTFLFIDSIVIFIIVYFAKSHRILREEYLKYTIKKFYDDMEERRDPIKYLYPYIL